MDITYLRQWLGKTEILSDLITPTPVAAMAAMLDRADPPPSTGDALPPMWHWLYFLPLPRQSGIGPDGHPVRGGFLPPVPLPRRMFAGSRLHYHQPLRVGDTITRSSTISDVRVKEGRSGPLVFVLVRHEISNAAGLALTEEHDIVYRDHPAPDDPAPAPQAAPMACDWTEEIRHDPVSLFRYSAVTFNGHRIHYDRPYAMETEGYPGLVVHGPLIATHLTELLRRHMPQASLKQFSFRAIRPTFDIAPFHVRGRLCPDGMTAKLWAHDADGWLTMEAQAVLA